MPHLLCLEHTPITRSTRFDSPPLTDESSAFAEDKELSSTLITESGGQETIADSVKTNPRAAAIRALQKIHLTFKTK